MIPTPKGHIEYGAPARFYAWEVVDTGQVRWQWNDEYLATQYCVNNSLTLMKSDETNARDYFTAPAPTLEQCREVAKLISGGDIDRLMERDGVCVEWLCNSHTRLQSENGALRSALERVTGELAELIKGEHDEPSVGIVGWDSLHESVAAARATLNQGDQS